MLEGGTSKAGTALEAGATANEAAALEATADEAAALGDLANAAGAVAADDDALQARANAAGAVAAAVDDETLEPRANADGTSDLALVETWATKVVAKPAASGGAEGLTVCAAACCVVIEVRKAGFTPLTTLFDEAGKCFWSQPNSAQVKEAKPSIKESTHAAEKPKRTT